MTPVDTIRRAVDRLWTGAGIRRVYLAGGSTPPPQLAYLVSFPRLTVMLSGHDRVEAEVDGIVRTIVVKAGDALFVPANGWNRPAWASPAVALTILFGKRQTGLSLVRRDRAGGMSATKAHVHRPLHGPLPAILDALNQCADADVARLLAEAAARCTVAQLDAPPGTGKAARTFQNVCLYLQANFQFPLTRDSVAEHFGLSPNHVSRLFRREGLMSFNDYLTWVRIDRAKFLLRHHDIKLADVATRCGFSDVGYFCRVFKRKTKRTPGGYRGRE